MQEKQFQFRGMRAVIWTEYFVFHLVWKVGSTGAYLFYQTVTFPLRATELQENQIMRCRFVLNLKYRLLVADGKKRVHTADYLKLADTHRISCRHTHTVISSSFKFSTVFVGLLLRLHTLNIVRSAELPKIMLSVFCLLRFFLPSAVSASSSSFNVCLFIRLSVLPDFTSRFF